MQLVSGVASLLTPSATIRMASTSRPESVSSRMESLGSSIAIWNISLRFFSPPENPSFTDLLASLESSSTIALFSRISLRKSAAFIGSLPSYFRFSLMAARMKLVIDTPGISTGYWNERNSPSWARSSGFMARRSLPLNTAVPPVTSYNGLPTSTALSVDFPEPFGPMMAWVSPSLMVRLIPFNISLLPILACKSLTSNIKPSIFNIQYSIFNLQSTPPFPQATRSATSVPRRQIP